MPSEASEHLGVATQFMGIGEFVKKNLQSEQKKRLVKKIGRRRDLQDVEFAIHAVSNFFNHLHMAFLDQRIVLEFSNQ